MSVLAHEPGAAPRTQFHGIRRRAAAVRPRSPAVEAAMLSASKSMEVPQKARTTGALLLCSGHCALRD